jgi:ParB family chromosome partitioning protein
MRDWFAAKVEIKLKGKDAGKIVIEFASNDDFERILGKLRRAA